MHPNRRTVLSLLCIAALPNAAQAQTGTSEASAQSAVRALLAAMEENSADGIIRAFSPAAA
jgi:predicted nicotinamide N-methyase